MSNMQLNRYTMTWQSPCGIQNKHSTRIMSVTRQYSI